jgi:hypothetical protein
MTTVVVFVAGMVTALGVLALLASIGGGRP